MSSDKAKESAAIAAVNEQINSSVHIIGVGSGSTIVPAVKRIAELVKKDKLDLICVPTSLQARELILSNGLKLGSLVEYQELDVAIDGADEVDEQFNCIKGGGGCQTQEKLVAFCAKKFVVVAEEKKWSTKLGDKWQKGVPIEVLPVAYKITKKEIEKQLGGEVVVREGTAKMGPVITDQGNFILDWKFDASKASHWSDVNQKLKLIPGVVETGLFINMISKAYLGNSEGKVEVKTNPAIHKTLFGMTEYQLQNPPSDGITAVHFSPNNQSQFLAASSWDGSIRLYDVNQHNFRHMYKHAGPVLDCCFLDSSRTASGGLDRALKTFDFNTQQETVMGYHDNAIRCVHYSPEVNVLITGSWDSSIKCWDPRMPNCLGTISLPDKVYTLDSVGEVLVVGTAQRKVSIWDLRKISSGTPIENRESNLKYQTRCIRCFPNKQGYVLSSIEGRVAVELFDSNPEIQKKKYAFKCHRTKEGEIENIFPVNAIAFHKQHGTFATGGSDAFVNMWDGANKKRLCQFHQYPAGITSLAFSPEGNMLAIASSYNYEYGADLQSAPNDVTKNNIFVRRVSDLETKPK